MQLQDLPLQNKEIGTQNPFDIAWEEKTKKNKVFLWFPIFRFEPYTQKGKLGNHRNSTKTL